MFRVGNGIDAHAFADGVPLWLGGVHIPSDRGLAGHSDGDAVSHAIIDALLGAVGGGDIGALFPSNDERWRGARSTGLLSQVWEALASEGWRLENVDVTVVTQAPTIGPHREAMRAVLAQALGASVHAVSVKATTTDRLGALGRGEGLTAVATALLSHD